MNYLTTKKVIPLVLLPCILFASLHVRSEPSLQNVYSIQVGAYKKVSNAPLAELENFGAVTTELNDSSITRVTVGQLKSWSEAKALLARLRSQGFSDAFITNIKPKGAATTKSAITQSKAAKLEALSPEDRPFAVYLDGDLYLKRGNQFTPVE